MKGVKETNPRKGTETQHSPFYVEAIRAVKETNPRKGTET